MKSRKSSLHDKINITKPKITTTKSHTSISNTNKSLTNIFLKKNLSVLQTYNNLFGQKVSVHIGDADTIFRKSLRKYNDFNYQKNTSWIKTKESLKSPLHFHQAHIEQKKAAGDSLRSEREPSELSLSESRSSSESTLTESTISMAEAEEIGEEVVATEEVAAAEEEKEAKVEDPGEGEGAIAEAPEAETAEAEDVDIKQEPAEGEEAPKSDEELKELLDKSLEELKTAVEQLDADALTEISSKVTDKVGELEGGATGAATGDATGDNKSIVPLDNNVLLELERAELQARSTANIINELKERVAALLNKDHMTDAEAKELEEMNRQLVKHMEDFEAKTKLIQTLVNFADQHIKPMKQLPVPQKRQPEDMLPKVIICGTTENNMPKIIICDADKKKRSRSSQSNKPSVSQQV